MKGFSSKRVALKVGVLKDRKIYCLQVRACVRLSARKFYKPAVKVLTSVHCCKTELRVSLSIFDAANVYFARELRSCVKVEVAVLGSRRP